MSRSTQIRIKAREGKKTKKELQLERLTRQKGGMSVRIISMDLGKGENGGIILRRKSTYKRRVERGRSKTNET